MPVTEIGINLPNAVGAHLSAARGRDEIVVEGRRSPFAELVDVVNPLQHIPLASDVYRAATGDKISDGAKLGGHVAIGAAAGGPVGALIGAGVFLLEKLFGGGGKASKTEDVELRVRPEDRAVANALFATGTERQQPVAAKRTQGPKSPPELSSAQFAALLSSFQPVSPARKDVRDEDVAGRMRANLDKLDELKSRQ